MRSRLEILTSACPSFGVDSAKSSPADSTWGHTNTILRVILGIFCLSCMYSSTYRIRRILSYSVHCERYSISGILASWIILVFSLGYSGVQVFGLGIHACILLRVFWYSSDVFLTRGWNRQSLWLQLLQIYAFIYDHRDRWQA